MSITRLKKLPYSKNLNLREIAQNLSLCWLYCGSKSWDAKNDLNDRSVVLPPNENPFNYDFSFMRGQTVIAHSLGFTELDYRERVAYQALLAGAVQVLFILPKQEHNFKIGSLIAMQLVSSHERYVR